MANSTSSNNVVANKMVKPYISLETQLLPKEKLYPTPSMKDGLAYEDEFDLRITGCELIQTSGRLLKLPQTAMATGQILFHRYYYTKSFVKNNMEYYAMASIYLSSKIEESPRSIRDVINVFNNIKQVRTGKLIKPVPIDQSYYDLKNQVIKAERRILKELGFCVHVKHPHKVILIYLTAMDCNKDKSLIQKAWNYMNDSLRTDVFLRYTPQTVACACIYLSARELKIPLPTNPQWFTIFGADEDALKSISIRLLHLYAHTPKTQEELEKIVIACRDNLNQEKVRSKEASQAQLQSTIGEDTKDSTPTTSAVVQEIKTASTTPSSDIAVITTSAAASVTTTTTPVPTSTTSQVAKPTIITKTSIINNTNVNITHNTYHHNNYYNNHHHHHHSNHHSHPQNSHYQQYQHQHYQYNQSGYHGYQNSYPIEHGEYFEMEMEPFYKYGDAMNGVKRKDIGRSSSKSHKKHSKRHSRSRSRTRSESRSASTSPKHKRSKKRTSREKYRSKSKSRSSSPSSKHKKKKYHHKSRSKDSDYVYDPRYKNVLV